MPLFPRRTNGNLWLAFQCFCSMEKCMGECKRLSSVRKVSSSSSSLRLNRWKAVESSEKRAERVGNWVEKGTAFPGRKCTSAAYSWQELYLRNFVAAPFPSPIDMSPGERWILPGHWHASWMEECKVLGGRRWKGTYPFVCTSPAGLCNWIARRMARIFGILQFDWRFLSLTDKNTPLIWIDFRAGQKESTWKNKGNEVLARKLLAYKRAECEIKNQLKYYGWTHQLNIYVILSIYVRWVTNWA